MNNEIYFILSALIMPAIPMGCDPSMATESPLSSVAIALYDLFYVHAIITEIFLLENDGKKIKKTCERGLSES